MLCLRLLLLYSKACSYVGIIGVVCYSFCAHRVVTCFVVFYRSLYHQVLERFFETKVAVPPYRQNMLKTFIAMLNTQAKVLRDFIRILQLEEITSDPNNPQVGVTVIVSRTADHRTWTMAAVPGGQQHCPSGFMLDC